MTREEDGRAERLALWIRTMSLSDQVLITSTTLVFEQIKAHRDDLPFPIDEGAIREAATPREAIEAAQALAYNYASARHHTLAQMALTSIGECPTWPGLWRK